MYQRAGWLPHLQAKLLSQFRGRYTIICPNTVSVKTLCQFSHRFHSVERVISTDVIVCLDFCDTCRSTV